MKKLVLVVAMFMFVCGGSFLVKAQSSAEAGLTVRIGDRRSRLSLLRHCN